MEFKEFKKQLQSHVESMLEETNHLFLTDTDTDMLWNLYLDSFPEGMNEIFRERREFDCSCCKSFIRNYGNVVVIKDNEPVSIWDFFADDNKFAPVISRLSEEIRTAPIKDIFVTKERGLGTNYSREPVESGGDIIWDHFYLDLPKRFVSKSHRSEGDLKGEARDIKNVFKRSLDEITIDAIETLLDLISQKSLYRGEEWKDLLIEFLKLRKYYHNLHDSKKDNFCWVNSLKLGGVSKIRNHSIGTLLINISEGMELDIAVKKYEVIVAPSNYKRPKAIFTKKMVVEAQGTIEELGLSDSLRRRFAQTGDITINNILFANRQTAKNLKGSVFDELKKEISVNPKKLGKVEEIGIDTFVLDVLPNINNMEILFENKHTPNLVSLIAPITPDSKTLFKWDNNFSWAYNGNITDSMKERVKAAGGNIDAELRFSIQWNEEGDDSNDYDAHCVEPNNNHIWYRNARIKHPSTGMLDIDITHPQSKQIAIENITWIDKAKMPDGVYRLYVHNYCYRGGRSGFRAEVEFDGKIYSFAYDKEVVHDENVPVANVELKDGRFSIVEWMPSSESSKNVWGVSTNQFHPISVMMMSPNYWDGQRGSGNRHFFFMMNNCRNDSQPNGFFNEFLKEEFLKQKRVFEALGSKMKVQESDQQLSGIGFSSTKRNSVICKVDGNFTRTLKIAF